MSEQNKSDWKQRELGGLWRKVDENGETQYLYGILNLENLGIKQSVMVNVIFNKYKKDGDKLPHYKVLIQKSNDKPKGKQPQAARTTPPVAKTTQAPVAQKAATPPPAASQPTPPTQVENNDLL
jgi:hypothetical protein